MIYTTDYWTWGRLSQEISDILKASPEIASDGVYFDFCGLAPTGRFYCDRGYYNRRSIQCGSAATFPSPLTVAQFSDLVANEIGVVRDGWKGWEYECRLDTLVTVTLEPDYSAQTMIVGVATFFGGLILITQMEYLGLEYRVENT